MGQLCEGGQSGCEMPELTKQSAMYRRRAGELRTEAGAATHAETKQFLLSIADSYDKLAALIERPTRVSVEGELTP